MRPPPVARTRAPTSPKFGAARQTGEVPGGRRGERPTVGRTGHVARQAPRQHRAQNQNQARNQAEAHRQDQSREQTQEQEQIQAQIQEQIQEQILLIR